MVWEEFVEAVDGVGVDAGQDVAEPSEGLDADELAGAGEAAQDRGRVVPRFAYLRAVNSSTLLS